MAAEEVGEPLVSDLESEVVLELEELADVEIQKSLESGLLLDEGRSTFSRPCKMTLIMWAGSW